MKDYEAVKSCVKWLDGHLKDLKKKVEIAEKEECWGGGFEDCGDFYRENLIEAKCEFNTTLRIKIGLERYAKKLKHESMENK